MSKEIINRVAKSPLITIDLEELYPTGKRIVFDVAPWLLEGIILKEQDFRAQVKNHDWTQYKDNFVALHCSTDAIIPAWAFMLIGAQLAPYSIKTIVGSLTELETIIYSEILNTLDISEYENVPVIVKGCSKKPIPETAFIQLVQKLQPVAKSIMYGEACSAVPLFKK